MLLMRTGELKQLREESVGKVLNSRVDGGVAHLCSRSGWPMRLSQSDALGHGTSMSVK